MNVIHAHANPELSRKQTTQNFKIAFFVTYFKAGKFILNVCTRPFHNFVLSTWYSVERRVAATFVIGMYFAGTYNIRLVLINMRYIYF